MGAALRRIMNTIIDLNHHLSIAGFASVLLLFQTQNLKDDKLVVFLYEPQFSICSTNKSGLVPAMITPSPP